MIIEIAFEDEKGVTRLLKKATDAGVKFTGEQLADICLCCKESEIERAIRFTADKFTDTDIENDVSYENKVRKMVKQNCEKHMIICYSA